MPIDNAPEYYTPNEDDLADLGKSIRQIFLEDLQKTNTFKSEFDVEAFENNVVSNNVNRDVALANRDAANSFKPSGINKSCVPCPKQEIIRSNLKQFKESVSLGLPYTPPKLNCCPGRGATAGGGSSSKDYKIYVCAETNRKYIRKSNERWYLDKNLGKYRYSDEKKTKIVVRAASLDH